MTLQDAFLQAIHERPDDDLPRLAYADWLEEYDDPRGELIHVQCRLARLGADNPERAALEERERALLAAHQVAWLSGVRPTPVGGVFRRGFLEGVTFAARDYAAGPTPPRPEGLDVTVDLTGFKPPAEVVEFIPAAIALENRIFPLGFRGRALILASDAPLDPVLGQKLEFIFIREVESVVAPAAHLTEAIDRHYGQMELESVDSGLLAEFVDVVMNSYPVTP